MSSSRWPDSQNLPNAIARMAQSLVEADGWPWLNERVEEQITSYRLAMTDGKGMENWEEYQFHLGLIAGLLKLTDIVSEHVSLDTGEIHD